MTRRNLFRAAIVGLFSTVAAKMGFVSRSAHANSFTTSSDFITPFTASMSVTTYGKFVNQGDYHNPSITGMKLAGPPEVKDIGGGVYWVTWRFERNN